MSLLVRAGSPSFSTRGVPPHELLPHPCRMGAGWCVAALGDGSRHTHAHRFLSCDRVACRDTGIVWHNEALPYNF